MNSNDTIHRSATAFQDTAVGRTLHLRHFQLEQQRDAHHVAL